MRNKTIRSKRKKNIFLLTKKTHFQLTTEKKKEKKKEKTSFVELLLDKAEQ